MVERNEFLPGPRCFTPRTCNAAGECTRAMDIEEKSLIGVEDSSLMCWSDQEISAVEKSSATVYLSEINPTSQ